MRIVLIGHTVGIKNCIEAVKNRPEYDIVAVFTHPLSSHKYDLELFEFRKSFFGEFAYNVFDVVQDYGIPLHEYESINSVETIKLIKETFSPDVIVTVGCRDILSKEFIGSFDRVINLHPFNIPYFRGAGIDSWMILQGYSGTTQLSAAHFIDEKIDSGNIICQEEYFIAENARPIDIFKERIATLKNLFIRALELIGDRNFVGVPQDHTGSNYYPRLFTPRDGHMNFAWHGKEIELFIRAFSFPYPGAFFIYDEKKVHVLTSSFHEKANVHPFSYGLIFRKTTEFVYVFVKDGYLKLSHFESGNEKFDLKKLKLGHFLK